MKSLDYLYHISAGTNSRVYLRIDLTIQELITSVAKEQLLGRVADLGRLKLVVFVPEQDFTALQEGSMGRFYLRDQVAPHEGVVRSLSPVRTPFLLYPQLGSLQGGPLPVVRGENDRLQLVETFYPVELELDSNALRVGQTGEAELPVGWRSKLVQAFRSLTRLLWQESGF